jgi:hypothetical protein|tara:strand:+ start:189 stop:407 length:219 start_codon:yes stop_codon:yes gene_type:complete
MKAQVKFEWRKLEEPEAHEDPSYIIMKALQAAGYFVGRPVQVQGVWDEDKPLKPGGPWDETRLPHEELHSEN